MKEFEQVRFGPRVKPEKRSAYDDQNANRPSDHPGGDQEECKQ